MVTMNKCMFAGYLTSDPELRFLPSGTPLARFAIGVNRRYKDKDGNNNEETSFLDFEAWSKHAELTLLC